LHHIHKIRLCLLTHNRPNYAKIALDSLVSNNLNCNCEIYVSDNSIEPSFSESLQNKYNNQAIIKFKYRNQVLNALDHMNLVINESLNFDFILLFHDDDILYSNYLEKILNLGVLNDKSFSAFAINANLIYNNKESKNKITHYKNNVIIKTSQDLIDAYFCLDSNGAPPFPGYLYRVSAIKNLELKNIDGGKHSDFSFLVDLLKYGNFFWYNEVLMSYRIHEKSGSNSFSIVDRNLQYNFLLNLKLNNKNAINDFNLIFLTEKLKNQHVNMLFYVFHLLKYLIINILNLRIFRIIYKRIKNRLID